MMYEYEARLTVSKWTNVCGWDYENDVLESWKVETGQVDVWKKMILGGDRSLFDYVTDSLDDNYGEGLEDSEVDFMYTIVLVEIDEDDVFGEGKVLASTSAWLSELLSDDEE